MMSPLQAFVCTTLFKVLPTAQLRVWYLRRMGARIGTNVRIHAVYFMNVESGFKGLKIGSDCYVGPGVLFDLAGAIELGDGAVVSARALVMSHDDPGSSHGSPLCAHFPPAKRTTSIGKHCWLGVGSIVLAGTEMGEQCVLAAGSVAKGKLCASSLYAGQPARYKKKLA